MAASERLNRTGGKIIYYMWESISKIQSNEYASLSQLSHLYSLHPRSCFSRILFSFVCWMLLSLCILHSQLPMARQPHSHLDGYFNRKINCMVRMKQRKKIHPFYALLCRVFKWISLFLLLVSFIMHQLKQPFIQLIIRSANATISNIIRNTHRRCCYKRDVATLKILLHVVFFHIALVELVTSIQQANICTKCTCEIRI